jgi:hypothetical protein
MLAGGVLETVDFLWGQILPLAQIGVPQSARRNCPGRLDFNLFGYRERAVHPQR